MSAATEQPDHRTQPEEAMGVGPDGAITMKIQAKYAEDDVVKDATSRSKSAKRESSRSRARSIRCASGTRRAHRS
jgi:hypothetical protein